MQGIFLEDERPKGTSLKNSGTDNGRVEEGESQVQTGFSRMEGTEPGPRDPGRHGDGRRPFGG